MPKPLPTVWLLICVLSVSACTLGGKRVPPPTPICPAPPMVPASLMVAPQGESTARRELLAPPPPTQP